MCSSRDYDGEALDYSVADSVFQEPGGCLQGDHPGQAGGGGPDAL